MKLLSMLLLGMLMASCSHSKSKKLEHFRSVASNPESKDIKVGDIVVYEHLYGASIAKVEKTYLENGEQTFLIQPQYEGHGKITKTLDQISKETKEFNGVRVGQEALCEHLHGTFKGKIKNIFENGFVQVEIGERSYPYSDAPIEKFAEHAKYMTKVAWSAIPGNEKSPSLSYSCEYPDGK